MKYEMICTANGDEQGSCGGRKSERDEEETCAGRRSGGTYAEDQNLGGVVRRVGEGHRDGDGGRTVESVTAVTREDGTAHHLSRQFVEGLERVEQEGLGGARISSPSSRKARQTAELTMKIMPPRVKAPAAVLGIWK